MRHATFLRPTRRSFVYAAYPGTPEFDNNSATPMITLTYTTPATVSGSTRRRSARRCVGSGDVGAIDVALR